MENGKVTISLHEYNRLRDFERNIMDGNVYLTFSYPSYAHFGFYTLDEAIRHASETNIEYKKRCDELEAQFKSKYTKSFFKRLFK